MNAASAGKGDDKLGLLARVAGAAVLLAFAVAMAGAAGVERAENAAAVPPGTAPATAPAAINRFDSIVISRHGAPPVAASTGGVAGSAESILGASRIALALAAVLGLIFGLRWMGRRIFGLQMPGSASGGVRVLSRSVVSPRQQLMLIQVGRRLVLVGNSGTQMNPICEINDADEVADLLGQVNSKPASSPARSFGAMFSRSGKQFDEVADEPIEDDEPAGAVTGTDAAVKTIKADLGGLRQTVRVLAQQFRKN